MQNANMMRWGDDVGHAVMIRKRLFGIESHHTRDCAEIQCAINRNAQSMHHRLVDTLVLGNNHAQWLRHLANRSHDIRVSILVPLFWWLAVSQVVTEARRPVFAVLSHPKLS